MKHQGWANYQTWAVKLWYNKDRWHQDMCLDIARNGLVTEDPRTHTADALKEYTETVNPLQDDSSMFSDMMNNAIGSVDWYEIADAFLEMVRGEGEEQAEVYIPNEERMASVREKLEKVKKDASQGVTGDDHMPQV